MVAVSGLVSCSTGRQDAIRQTSSATSGFTAPAPVSGSAATNEPGTVVSRNVFEGSGSLAGLRGYRVVYSSTAGYAPIGTEVSGVVVVPPGDPPVGGWPIIAFGHGTTGTTPDCGPSDHPDLLGESGTVADLARAGYVVAATDYQGLGARGNGDPGHPYLEPRTVAHNMIDMVRAARTVVPQTSREWASFGSSQGGRAAWAAAESASDYGSDLDFVGAAALAPAADTAPLVTVDHPPTFTYLQKSFLPMIIDGLAVVYPTLDRSQFIRGQLAAHTTEFTSCPPNRAIVRYSALTTVAPGDATIADRSARLWLHTVLSSWALPQRRAAGPILVINGSDDQIVAPDPTTGAVARAVAMGDDITHEVRPGRGHTDLHATDEVLTWLSERFADHLQHG
ncbi:lipase family protein [Gordonia jinhuaensis]|uniref:Lipase n=1 Tax=Gordonia jinhuaensis TaxID=1517702 RepID=A0A916T2R8_9ACTN|nr:lipase family protein [Gordonia jinhuaensis]GGB29578.1 putative lipase [Gordonia jinhuaensis]